jgi:hypothetical protein
MLENGHFLVEPTACNAAAISALPLAAQRAEVYRRPSG